MVEEKRNPLTQLEAPKEVLTVVPSGMVIRSVDTSTERSSKEPEGLGVELMQPDRKDRGDPVAGERSFSHDQAHGVAKVEGRDHFGPFFTHTGPPTETRPQ